jgi:hypothetical protein
MPTSRAVTPRAMGDGAGPRNSLSEPNDNPEANTPEPHMTIRPANLGATIPPTRSSTASSAVTAGQKQATLDHLQLRGSNKPPVVLAGSACGLPFTATGQREKALQVTRECKERTVGAAIRPMLERATSIACNVASDTLGDFYESQKALLNSPATDANIDKFAKLETEFFAKSPSWSARNAGSLLTADQRAYFIKKAARDQGAPAQ